ncbi:MAG TPA: hypothetical protein VHY91_05060 [Pirellulales bacterium]|jgi:hypothetical protein|nr:hypothetical protein [Pirellulales bacterium]
MLTNDQVTEEVIARLAAPRDTATLSQLVTERHDCLRQLAELGSWQLEAVRGHDMNRLLALLAVKQRLLVGLQTLERQLDPFRRQDADERQWISSEARQRCAQLAAESEVLLAQVVRQEIESEQEMHKQHDASADRLQAAHAAAMARGAYAAEDRAAVRHLDLSSDR